jgi:DNA-binding Xre family transcriptional regulator
MWRVLTEGELTTLPKVTSLALRYKIMLRILLREAMGRHVEKTGESLTYAVLAKSTGIAQSTLESMGSRRGYHTSTKNIEALCRFFHCAPCDLLTFEEEHSTTPGYAPE